jgi:hypothetical protein
LRVGSLGLKWRGVRVSNVRGIGRSGSYMITEDRTAVLREHAQNSYVCIVLEIR